MTNIDMHPPATAPSFAMTQRIFRADLSVP